MQLRLVLLLFPAALVSAQITPATPPLRTGLWQTEITVEVSGLPGSTGAPSTVVKRYCMKPGSWKDLVQNPDSSADCTTANLQQDAHHLAFDQTCRGKDGLTATAHVEMELDSKEAMHGTSSMNMTVPGLPHGMMSKSRFKWKYVTAECGDLKPGEQRDGPAGAY
ncbi:MAG TPA: DUF3617 family protein [Acidobacteriaceae bacterium]|nr:DUF3617 family protein [Acidobacteriaceae bacterium]